MCRGNFATIKEIVADPHQAEAEVRRLNELNHDKKCYYFSTITRLKGYTIEVEQPCGIESAPSG